MNYGYGVPYNPGINPGVCPGCGRCNTCGRGGYQPYTMPYIQPIQPIWTTTGTNSTAPKGNFTVMNTVSI